MYVADDRCIPMPLQFRRTTLLLGQMALLIQCIPYLLPINSITVSPPSRCLCRRGHLLLLATLRASRRSQQVSRSTQLVLGAELMQCLGHLQATKHLLCICNSRRLLRCTCRQQRHNSHSPPLPNINLTTCTVTALVTLHIVYCNRPCLCVFCLFVWGFVTMITRNCMHRSSPNWVCR